MIKNKKLSNKYLLIGVFVLVALLIAGFYYVQKDRNDSTGQISPTEQTETINLDPPTEEDAKRVESNKEKNLARDEALNSQPAVEPRTKKTVKPTITYAGQYDGTVEVGSYVGGIFEDGGTCTATFSMGNASFSRSVTAVKNINSVNCPVISASNSEFNQKGNWSVSVSYDSSSASGMSDPRQFEIK